MSTTLAARIVYPLFVLAFFACNSQVVATDALVGRQVDAGERLSGRGHHGLGKEHRGCSDEGDHEGARPARTDGPVN